MANSVLSHIGNIFKTIWKDIDKVATVAEPIVDIAFPAVAPIYNTALALSIKAESTVEGVSGNGPQKLAKALSELEPIVEAWAKQNNINFPKDQIEKWLSAVVDSLNLIPAPTPPAA